MKPTFFLISIIFLLCCSPQGRKSPLGFNIDQEQLYELVKKQVSFGSRPAGSHNLKRLFDWMKSYCQQFPTIQIKQQETINFISGKKRIFRNLIIHYPNKNLKNKDFIIIGSHYDTKDKIDNFVGANDAGSSTAILLYLIKLINQHKKLAEQINCELRFVFFDGEEAYNHYTYNDGLVGSKYYVQELIKNENIKNCRAVIIADMLGDKELKIQIPKNTNQQLSQKAIDAAKSLSLGKYISQGETEIIDDHLPFHELNIPSTNLIDFEFGKDNHLWHTHKDNLSNISKENLAISTKILLKLIINLAQK